MGDCARAIAFSTCCPRSTRHQKIHVIIVGIGVGAYMGLVFGRLLRSAGGRPRWLFGVCPCASFPAPKPQALGPCAVTCFLPEFDTFGDRWRFEVATRGPF